MKIIGIDYSLTSPAITLYNGNDNWNYSSGSCTHFCLASNERQRSKWAEIRSVKTDIYPAWETDLQRYHGLANWVINCCITAINPERMWSPTDPDILTLCPALPLKIFILSLGISITDEALTLPF